MTDSIIRVEHDKDCPYLQIAKVTVLDKRLSLAERGFLIACLTFPDDWKFHQRELAKRLDINKDTVTRHLAALEKAGYCRSKKVRGSDGRWEAEYTILECPDGVDRSAFYGQDRSVFSGPDNTDILITLEPKEESSEVVTSAAAHFSKPLRLSRTPHGRMRVLYSELYQKRLGVRAPFSPVAAGQLKNAIAARGEAGFERALRELFARPPANMRSFKMGAIVTFLPDIDKRLAERAAEAKRVLAIPKCPSCGQPRNSTAFDCLFCGARDVFKKGAVHAIAS